jgi:UV DNA damage endonuclease
MIRLGYACIHTRLPSPNRTCRLRNATPGRILELARHNLDALFEILKWNRDHGIRVFRISSDTIPFASHSVNRVEWEDILGEQLDRIGAFIRDHGMRVSMHPGQYTVLNSPRKPVVENAVAELVYHARLLDGLGVGSDHKIVLHVGGVYGDPDAAARRFMNAHSRLPETVRRRLVIENDEKNFNAEAVAAIAGALSIPMVFDVFHHACLPSFGGRPLEWIIQKSAAGWTETDGRPKIHYSDQGVGKPVGAHSEHVDLDAFLRFFGTVREMDLDIMLEVKDKERSLLAIYDALPGLRKGGKASP